MRRYNPDSDGKSKSKGKRNIEEDDNEVGRLWNMAMHSGQEGWTKKLP